MVGPHAPRTRRAVLRLAALAAAAAVIGPDLAKADAKAVAAELKKLFGGKTMASGKIKLDVPRDRRERPRRADHGRGREPDDRADYVKAVHVFAEGNPLPGVRELPVHAGCGPRLGLDPYAPRPDAGHHLLSPKCRTARCSPAKAEVKVTIGGCGG
jgi:sulfur-oxidizing protein SoxY